MDPQEQYNAMKAIEGDGGELLAIYHSHTKSAAYPSQTDVNLAAAWPEQIYLIVSLADEDAPDVKGYLLRDLRIADAEIVYLIATVAIPVPRVPMAAAARTGTTTAVEVAEAAASWSKSPSPRVRWRPK